MANISTVESERKGRGTGEMFSLSKERFKAVQEGDGGGGEETLGADLAYINNSNE